jgi:hypothetical protein
MAMRKLPVIQEPAGEDAEAALRPAWQWVLIGSGLLVTIWTPTVAVSLAIARRLASSADGAVGAGPAALLVAVTFALSALAAGYLVARFGPRARLRHTAWSGVLAGAEIWVLALLGGAFTSVWVAVSAFASLAALASAFCALGGWLRRRKK